MAANDTHPTATETRPGDQPAVLCSACAHPWADHDQISARFCAATTVERHNRGCVCVTTPKAN